MRCALSPKLFSDNAAAFSPEQEVKIIKAHQRNLAGIQFRSEQFRQTNLAKRSGPGITAQRVTYHGSWFRAATARDASS